MAWIQTVINLLILAVAWVLLYRAHCIGSTKSKELPNRYVGHASIPLRSQITITRPDLSKRADDPTTHSYMENNYGMYYWYTAKDWADFAMRAGRYRRSVRRPKKVVKYRRPNLFKRKRN